MIDLRSLTMKEMEDFLVENGFQKFRAKQIYDWIYKGVTSVKDIKTLSEKDREKLRHIAKIGTVEAVNIQVSEIDETRKYLFELEDGNKIESVYMKYKYGSSVCISSQAGCRMGCKFCASTMRGLARNLTAGEMISQIMEIRKDTKKKISHIVIMGTGEPFDNYDNVADFIRIANDPKGLGIGIRNITVSTCGLVPMIKKFAEDFPQVNLAISLHGTTDEIRSSMMPVNSKYNIETLLEACFDYTKQTSRRITFEYTLVNGKNDSDEDADRLCTLLHGMLCHVNLIPLNKVNGTGFDTVSRDTAKHFKKILESNGIPATVRRELGSDIDAACGQLRLRIIGKA